MTRQRIPLQINQFVGGINTEANPLSYPINNSLDEVNMDFNRDGSRKRRLGFDVEEFYNELPTGVNSRVDEYLARNQFRWDNVGGDPELSFMVVQIGNYVGIHNLNSFPLSSTPVYSKLFDSDKYSSNFNFASIDGELVVATGEKNIYIYSYKNNIIEEVQKKLLVRDLFGVEATVDGVKLTDAENTQVRPTSLTNTHTYNLRNQTYALPRTYVDNDNIPDTIEMFNLFTDYTTFPSNGDSVNPFLFANTDVSSDREVLRYWAQSAVKTFPDSAKAPIGYFIIDALDRGTSRLEKIMELQDRHPRLLYEVTDGLPEDSTPGGPSVITQYAGRVWYAGFSGAVVGGDERSPVMSSYVLFSQTVTDPSEINLCYQAADPTSNEDPDLVDTDGGFIKIDGAYNIKALVPLGTSLFVLADNGIWRVSGIDNNTFVATDYSISRLSNNGCISGSSAVVADNRLVYWSESSIYGVELSELGDWQVTNISQDTIQSLYDDILVSDKEASIGYYDDNSNAVRWVYGSNLQTLTENNELILNFRFNAYSKNTLGLLGTNKGIFSVASGDGNFINSNNIVTTSTGITVSDTNDGPITVERTFFETDKTDAFYCIITNFDSEITYTFGRYERLDTKRDWVRYGTPVDTPAYIETGPVTGGDARLRKDVPYLTTHFEQDDPSSDNHIPSSCLVRAKWGWTPSESAGRWSVTRQAYREQRSDNAGGILSTRNRIRGHGRSVSFRLESEADKELHIYGWESNLQSTSEE